jgi:predicted small secreted protein
MKTRKSRYLLIALFIAGALLLSACKVNFITDIKSDGSGNYTQEIGFEGDEATMGDLSADDADFCANQSQDLPPNTTTRKETRNETETWCIYETPFNSLDELQTIYGTTDTLVNEISLVGGKLTYDITLDLSGDTGSSDAPLTADISWNVTLPGRIIENNATEQNNNSLKWKLVPGVVNSIRAVSEPGGLNLGGDVLWYVLGGGAFLCLFCFLPLVLAGVAFFLIRRKKIASADQPA